MKYMLNQGKGLALGLLTWDTPILIYSLIRNSRLEFFPKKKFLYSLSATLFIY